MLSFYHDKLSIFSFLVSSVIDNIYYKRTISYEIADRSVICNLSYTLFKCWIVILQHIILLNKPLNSNYYEKKYGINR